MENGINLIPGPRSIKEAILYGKIHIIELWIGKGKESPLKKEIIGLAGEKGIPVFYKKAPVLDDILPGTSHQGIVAIARDYQYSDLGTVVKNSRAHPEKALLIAVDHVTDEGNLGAIIRTAAFFGADGLILPKDRSARVTPRVMKNSSGGYTHLPISIVVNLGRTLDSLTKDGFWIIGTAGEGRESIYTFDWRRDILLILGNEEKGISPSIKKRCHEMISIPSSGSLNALNVSVAAGVILSEIVRQRTSKKTRAD
jgi:23S rRNA (guanosine2251-2'-O)-methyltransferase